MSIVVLVTVLTVLWLALAFVRDTDAPEQFLIWFYNLVGLDSRADALLARGLPSLTGKLVIAIVALTVGVAGIWAVFIAANRIVDEMPQRWSVLVRPYVFVGPAMFLLTLFLILPVFNTIYTSLSEDIVAFPDTVPAEFHGEAHTIEAVTAEERHTEYRATLIATDRVEIATINIISRRSDELIGTALILRTGDSLRTFGLGNYKFAFGSREMHIAFRNNILWLLFGVTGAVGIGLLFAQLVDKVKREAFAKTFVFLPMAISFVGAAVIWRFVYWWRPPGSSQIGVLNAVWTRLGNEPVAWMQTMPLNTFALIVVMIWLMTGFAMVILSAAIKGVPTEIIEAARIDGTNEFQLFFRIIMPSIKPSIITVSTVVFIAVLKVFDIVFVMTGGRFKTEVIANRMFAEMFKFRNFGRASALAVILLAVVIPIIVVNVKNLKRQGTGA